MIKRMYVTLMPVIFSGIFNMIFTRTSFYRSHCQPIDRGKKFLDGRRIFGDNKTFAGFFGMIIFGAVSQILWGFLCRALPRLENLNDIYLYNKNSITFNAFSGMMFGLAYVLFELPNSFIKRRIDIPSGKTVRGIKGLIFFILDQTDSLFGVVLVLSFFCKITPKLYFMYILLGGFTHIAVNLILYSLKIRKNI